MSNVESNEYKQLLTDLKQRIRSAQYAALKAVNKELINLYWDIGKLIETRQQGKTWGKSIVEKLAEDLRNEFPGLSGFSATNLWRAKSFYEAYCHKEKLAPLVGEIGWSHNIIILEKCKDDFEREFYIKMTRKFGWTKNILIHQIEGQTYQKTLLVQNNFDKTIEEKYQNQAQLAVKDEYTFEFLDLEEEYNEKELERAILRKIEPFLIEMGGLFSFIGSQYRLQVEDSEFFIDLLLYHRALKSLVAIELKVTEFKPEYAGKMQFYLTALDETLKMHDENPSIGIILCKSKNRTVVEYTLKDVDKPIGVSSYTTVTELPNNLKGQLPAPDQIKRLLDEI